jgi:phosphoglycerate dehydrogenase-like enzyme
LLLECPELAVHNLHHNAVPTAEMALTLMLTAVKSIVLIDRALRNSDWTPRYSPSNASILRDKTALVLGFGAIGREIATMCTGLGMRVTALRRREVCERESAIDIRSIDKLREQLPSARVLFVSMPFTPETEGIIGRDELSLLPDGAVLVNIARGPLVDEAALYAELQSGRLRAGLDVWYNYPKEETDRTKTSPANYPFHELDNVVMTPHLAGHSEDTERLRVEAMAELLNLAVAGEALPNVVDPRRGY